MRFIQIFAIILTVIPSITATANEILPLINVFHHSDSLITSGQPAEKDIEYIAKAKIDVVINLSPANLPASLHNEKSLVENQGMSYYAIPVEWNHPTIEDVKSFFDVMKENKGKRILAHCWLNARSSAFVYLYRTIQEDYPEERERKILEQIWNNNKFGLDDYPEWRMFINQIKESDLSKRTTKQKVVRQLAAAMPTNWPSFMPDLPTGPANSSSLGQLPTDVKVIPPGPEVPSKLARLSGIWTGWHCRQAACSVRIAVEKLDAKGGEIAYGYASSSRGQNWNVRASAKWEQEELRANTNDGWTIILRIRKSGVMESILFDPQGRWTAGVLSKN